MRHVHVTKGRAAVPVIDELTVFWIAGLVGVAFYLGSYAGLQSGLLSGAGYPYTILNLIASSLVLVSLMSEWSLSSALIQVSWIAISLIGLTRLYIRHRMLRFTQEEQDLVASCFATMPRLAARRVLDMGVWLDAPQGYGLTEEGMPVESFYFVVAGGADVQVGGLKIAEVGAGSTVGEMGCLSHAAASACVQLNRPSRLFRIRSDDLARIVRRDAELKPHLEYAFAHATRQKLVDTNAALRAALHRSETPFAPPQAQAGAPRLEPSG